MARSKFFRVWIPVALAAVLVAFAAVVTTVEPEQRRPGFRLSGEVVKDDVTDWSIIDSYPTIAVETRAPWLLPHSVTTIAFRHAGKLYVPSRSPQGKRWVENVLRDPRVRLKIGEKIYPRRALRVEDRASAEALFGVLAAKHPGLRRDASGQPEIWVFHMAPPEAG